jgi:hypothetical protein
MSLAVHLMIFEMIIASKQALHFVKVLLEMEQSFCLEMLSFCPKFPFISCLESGLPIIFFSHKGKKKCDYKYNFLKLIFFASIVM